ncbi:deoxynucleoside triphosphate triphosphohydrolase SAMHD1-like [Ptychodera flava]|uniref:deoxynucleoside triphosphate triphosphohydrolase SAMHD1-like n=1 Tax=Ptychodera flava TaxID=63121 RepID=UPI00396A27CB
MVEKYNLKEVFRRKYDYKLNGHDFHMIKEMIYGPLVKNDKQEYKKADTYKAIQSDRHFLYQIVSNKANQIDVDKWDYFARDSHHLGVSSNFLHDRFINSHGYCKTQERLKE